MKRKALSVFLVLVLCLSLTLCVQADSGSEAVFDYADLLSDSEEARISAALVSISRQYNAQIVVATVESAEGEDPNDLTRAFYRNMDLGYGESDDGVLLLVCMDPREYRILSMGMAADAIENSEISSISDTIQPDLSAGNYADAFDAFAEDCRYYLDGHVNGYPFAFGMNLVIALVIGLIVGLITALTLKGQLKTVRKQNQANVYVKPGSMNLTVCNDLFLYRNVVRTKKPTSNSSSSGSRSSGNIGGGSF